jgi:hypothetical protein
VDVLLIAQNTTRHDDRAAERVVGAITRAIAAGTLSEARVREAVARVDTLRAKLQSGSGLTFQHYFAFGERPRGRNVGM